MITLSFCELKDKVFTNLDLALKKLPNVAELIFSTDSCENTHYSADIPNIYIICRSTFLYPQPLLCGCKLPGFASGV